MPLSLCLYLFCFFFFHGSLFHFMRAQLSKSTPFFLNFFFSSSSYFLLLLLQLLPLPLPPGSGFYLFLSLCIFCEQCSALTLGYCVSKTCILFSFSFSSSSFLYTVVPACNVNGYNDHPHMMNKILQSQFFQAFTMLISLFITACDKKATPI